MSASPSRALWELQRANIRDQSLWIGQRIDPAIWFRLKSWSDKTRLGLFWYEKGCLLTLLANFYLNLAGAESSAASGSLQDSRRDAGQVLTPEWVARRKRV